MQKVTLEDKFTTIVGHFNRILCEDIHYSTNVHMLQALLDRTFIVYEVYYKVNPLNVQKEVIIKMHQQNKTIKLFLTLDAIFNGSYDSSAYLIKASIEIMIEDEFVHYMLGNNIHVVLLNFIELIIKTFNLEHLIHPTTLFPFNILTQDVELSNNLFKPDLINLLNREKIQYSIENEVLSFNLIDVEVVDPYLVELKDYSLNYSPNALGDLVIPMGKIRKLE